MTEYQNYAVTLTKGQVEKIVLSRKKGIGTTIRLAKDSLQGAHKLPLTKTQINKIKKSKTGVQLRLSEAQLKYMEKTGGFLPLLSLIPLIIGGVGAAGGVAGGIASAVSAAKNAKAAAEAQAETERHNREIEAQLKSGSGACGGAVSDIVGNIPVLGNFLRPLLQKIGLGISDINKIKRGGRVCLGKGLYIRPEGSGLYLGPQATAGSGMYLAPQVGRGAKQA
jgi:hypothetical protein